MSFILLNFNKHILLINVSKCIQVIEQVHLIKYCVYKEVLCTVFPFKMLMQGRSYGGEL